MFRRLRSFISLNARNSSSKRLLHAKPQQLLAKPAMLDIVQEIAVYIHRFHNLDLFQQGWYQIKISMRWEDDSHNFSPGTPSRVVQYEVISLRDSAAPDVGSFDSCGVWRINDVDHSFSTQPFRIKYARPVVLLSVMISFNFALDKYEIPSMSAVILKFVLLYSPTSEDRCEFQASLDASPASVHEFWTPKALMGLHSYCPVHFDAFHAVLVDLRIHVVLLKAGTYRPLEKVSSESCAAHNVSGNHYEGQDQPAFSNTDTEVPDKIAEGTALASESEMVWRNQKALSILALMVCSTLYRRKTCWMYAIIWVTNFHLSGMRSCVSTGLRESA